MMNTYAGFRARPPNTQASQYATGSKHATTNEATSMRRGVLGAIIAEIKISRQIHEIRRMSVPVGGTAQALNAAIPAPCISIMSTPALLLFSRVVADRRKYQTHTAEPNDPHNCRTMARQFRTQPSQSHGMMNESSMSAKVHRTRATVLNTSSLCACSDSSSVGRRVPRPVSPADEPGA